MATRTIAAGEIILKEKPLTIAPEGNEPVCLVCYKTVTKDSPSCRCKKCGFSVCSKACADSKMHKTLECEAFMKHGFWASDIVLTGFGNSGRIISIIRTFLLREKDPDRWSAIWNLESNLKELQKYVLYPCS